MAKGYEANKQHQQEIAQFGKELGRRAHFTCEWCGAKAGLAPVATIPTAEPEVENLLLLCAPCRALHVGGDADPNRLRHLEGALWSSEPVVARSAAALLRRLGADWAEETIEEAGIDL
ncbi:MAG: hypothetical protein AUK30_02400 [Nitrospirae bacterium CG2_30_70_394]|nr:MAG: hypothetical protein AUK30_02400 [Nitrospirae bacterium CG2_30_70_394]PIU80247.1 MAG: hypothetical protein COS73_00250 [Nitrospirae bacterium CG06_land_8_20_14_3_00_70_43]PIW83035.1 MAG: hypothetical protein COZ96_05520 [Nitrospirae bacterium CG_4_8_14_3_um_filter_70_85]PIX84343.1 MAG: hypothetical protein COZ33_00755 [Nitrospirae bacterium CG_4_10_14_3_um_filter_70_108]